MKNVLLVDDNKLILLALSEWLRLNYGSFEILTAENGKEAVTILETTPIDVLVTDLTMPVMDGFELLKYIRTNRPNTPVIVMTGSSDSDVEEKLHELGFDTCMRKPFEFKKIGERILNLLNNGAGTSEKGKREDKSFEDKEQVFPCSFKNPLLKNPYGSPAEEDLLIESNTKA